MTANYGMAPQRNGYTGDAYVFKFANGHVLVKIDEIDRHKVWVRVEAVNTACRQLNEAEIFEKATKKADKRAFR